jgi:phage gp36-like protein
MTDFIGDQITKIDGNLAEKYVIIEKLIPPGTYFISCCTIDKYRIDGQTKISRVTGQKFELMLIPGGTFLVTV